MFGLRMGGMGRVGSGLTLTQAAANVRAAYSTSPQVWYDPSDLVWNWRRNLLTRSEEFDNAAWTKAAATITADATLAPDGTTTADKLVETATTAAHYVGSATLTINSGVSYVLSVYAKAAERSVVQIIPSSSVFGATAYANFDLSAGIVSASSGMTATIEAVGSGWYRCVAVATATSTGVTGPINIAVQSSPSAARVASYTGDGTSGIYLWGAQLEVGALTPYQRITDGVQDYYQYHPLPTLYQDSAGTTPVTAVGQPVGLMLDKSRGLVLGGELVSNGDFSNGATGWTAAVGTITEQSGTLNVAHSGANNPYASQSITTVIGKSYVVKMQVTASTTSGSKLLRVGTTLGAVNYGSGTVAAATGTAQVVFTATGTTLFVGLQALTSTLGESANFDNISVRELPGLHASQPTALSRPVLSSRYNLLTYTEQFDNAAWVKTRVTVSANATTAPDGTLTADKMVETVEASSHALQSGMSTIALSAHTGSVYLKAGERTWAAVGIGASTAGTAYFNLSTGEVGTVTGGFTASITSAGNGWWRCTVSGSIAATAQSPFAVYVATGNNGFSYTGDGTSGIFISGASLVPTNEAHLPYQRVAAATDYDADFSKFPAFLSVDGTDDGMVTPSWDLTSTDKVTVVAGVRKLSDAAIGVVAELSVSGDASGVFNLYAPATASTNFGFRSKGTAGGLAVGLGYGSPLTAVLAGLGDIGGDRTTARINGVQAAESTTDQGTGTYGNYPLYLFRRGGTSLPFNGRFYGLSIIGAQLSASDITVLEKFTAAKTGVTVV